MKHGNFAWLILALLIFLIAVPIADDLHVLSQPILRAIAFSLLLGIGVLSLRGAGKLFVIAMVIVVIGVALNFVAVQTSSTLAIYGSFLAIMAFLLIAISFTFHRVAKWHEITANRIVGAVAVYLLLGVLWSVLYTLVEIYSPGSFRGFDTGTQIDWESEWLYFSFVTMTTLGYGDIVPVSGIAKVLAYMQAIFGQFYIAILVAGLVGAYIARGDRESG